MSFPQLAMGQRLGDDVAFITTSSRVLAVRPRRMLKPDAPSSLHLRRRDQVRFDILRQERRSHSSSETEAVVKAMTREQLRRAVQFMLTLIRINILCVPLSHSTSGMGI